MSDPRFVGLIAAAVLAGLVVVALAGLRAWHEWLGLQRLRLEGGRAEPAPTAARIELADLRERVRRLEAIASGVDL